jgi:hypothetical protein
MDAGQVEACSVSCTWDGTDARLKELRSAVMQKTCWRGFTLLRRLKDLTPDVSRLWVQGMQMHPARKYELVLFKNTAKPNGDVDPGDQSKTACQLCDAEDPSLQLLQLLITLLLPGYKIGSVQDVLNGSMALEAYVISELGSRSGQPEHTDSAPEMAIAQHSQDCHGLHTGNMAIYQQGTRPPCTLWVSQRGPNDPAISVAIYVDSHHPALAAFTFRQALYEAGLKTFDGSHVEYDRHFLAAVAESLKEQFPELVSHRMRGQLVTPDHDGGLVLHGLLAHSGTGDEGYRLVAAADPPDWVRHPATTACTLADSGTLASMFGTIMDRIPRTKPTPAKSRRK